LSAQRKRNVVHSMHLAVTLSILSASVLGARYLIGLSSGVAVIAGGILSYPVATTVSKRLLPQPPVVTDEERLHLKIGPRWLAWIVLITPLLRFGAGLPWIWSISLVMVSVACAVTIELRKRSQARLRASSDS
jgi:uncharacterized oligopeptide transporter (OPT) family protein